MKLKTILACIVLAFISSVVSAGDTPPDGNYTYNNTTGSSGANVSNNGYSLSANGKDFLQNGVTGDYQSNGPPPETISFTDQGYRFIGVSSLTGVCTLYSTKAAPGPGF